MITAEEPKVCLTGRYKTMEACRILGLSKDTLRKYRRQGAIKCGYRRETGRPFYMGAELVRFWRAQL